MDVRGESAKASRSGVGGPGIFIYPTTAPVSSDILETFGSSLDDLVPARKLRTLETAIGLPSGTLASTTIRQLLEEIWSSVATDYSSMNFSNPRHMDMKKQEYTLSIKGLGLVTRRNATGQDIADWVAGYREIYELRRQEYLNEGLPLDNLRRLTGAKMLESRLSVDDLLGPRASDGFTRPTTSMGDDFTEPTSDANLNAHTPTGANVGSAGAWVQTTSFTEANVLVVTATGRVQTQTTGELAFYRIDDGSDGGLSSDDHFSEIEVTINGGPSNNHIGGVACRMPSGATPADTCLYVDVHEGVAEMNLFERTAGSNSFIGGDAYTHVDGETYRLDISGSMDYDALQEGVSVFSGNTTNRLAGNVHAGFAPNKQTNGDTEYDNYLADDGISGRFMGSIAGQGGLAGHGGIAGKRGGIAG